MGEAKRRKIAGVAIEPDAATILEVTKDWQGGISVTLDVEGFNPVLAWLDAGAITDMLDDVDKRMRGIGYRAGVKTTMDEFIKAARKGGEVIWWPPFALWIALRHPESGERLRQFVSDRLRDDDPVHITTRWNHRGLAIAVEDMAADLQDLRSPTDKAVVMFQSRPDKPVKLDS